MTEKEADKIIQEILNVFTDTDVEVSLNDSLTLFAKIQNIIYSHTKE